MRSPCKVKVQRQRTPLIIGAEGKRTMQHGNIVRAGLLLLGLCSHACSAIYARASTARVKVLFEPASPSVGPFPTDVLTVPDPAQKTGLRINLPMPDCQAEPSTCEEIAAVNQLDGFSIEPRLRVRFSGPINPDTLREGSSWSGWTTSRTRSTGSSRSMP